ncbi:MAG TPA: hypothetical protein VK814_07860 [Acidobacteriaceae bacterium]|nr:hypothetical protein [Acidobacteriaceae bacterium]
MRLSLPTRIPLSKVFVYSAVFFCVQQIEHTGLLFSLLYFAFVILSVLAFNFAEGFTRITGAYIFWYSTLIAIVGVTWKAVVGEAADSNLLNPLLDMALYAASMVMLLLVTLVNRRIDFRALGVGGGFSKGELNYTAAGLGCIIVWLGILFSVPIFGNAPGGLVSALNQVNVFGPLGIILATIGAIKDTGGRRSVNMISAAVFVYFGYLGLISFSKQIMISPMVCWAVGAFYARLRVRFVHVVAVVLMAVLSFGFISPLSASRDLAEGMDDGQHIVLAWYLFTHRSVLEEHVKQIAVTREMGVAEYYNEPQGSLIERLSMIPPDDELFTYSAKDHYEGMEPIYQYFGNLLPHFLNPDKQVTFSGNFYAHEMGAGLAEGDNTTGISFSPVAEAFHCEGWGGILWLLPVIWILLFSSIDFVVGDMTKYPWGLMVVVWFAHGAPEQLVGGMVYFMGYGNVGMVLAIIIVTRIAPILGTLFLGRAPTPSGRRMVSGRRIVAQAQG